MEKPLLTTLIRRIHLDIRREIHADLRAAGHADLAIAHMYVFQTPGPDGARPTELAERTNMTKQSMNHCLAKLEEGGYLQRVPSPTDRRATVIRLTRRGREVQRIMLESSRRLEREWARASTRPEIEQLRTRLTKLDRLNQQPEPTRIGNDA
ncbi:MAG TPA: MarR family transcriptional regulator [Acidimicrobiia bacterium]|nr:MarR family transcriptional regulator [Acidimicrobiia bacterium]